MSQRVRLSALLWGFLSVVAGALMAEGGLMEVIAYWRQGEGMAIGVGALGACASALLLVSGAAFWTGRPFGRRAAAAGAAGMIPVHLLGWGFGLIGFVGVVLGVAYPVLLLVMLRAKPDLGAPMTAASPRPHGDSPSHPRDLNRREASAVA